jgi:outer membrane lipoprotein-sorting protein
MINHDSAQKMRLAPSLNSIKRTLRLRLLSLLLVSLPFQLSAESRTSPVLDNFVCKKELSSQEAESSLKATQAGFEQLKSMKAQFYQDSYLMALDESELSAGTVSLLKPGKMRWHYSTPEEQVFIVKDEDIWLYQPRLNQVMIDSVDKVLISQLPTAFLIGIGDLSKDFIIKSACSSKAGIVLKLSPSTTSSDSSNLSDLELLVDHKNFMPLGARVLDVGGNQTSIVLKSIVINDKSVQSKDFEYEFPENLDIDDRRKVTEN